MYLRFNRLLCEYEPVAVKHIMYELNKNIKNMRESDISYTYYLSINTIDDLSDKRINWRDVERIKRPISYICDLYAKYSPNEVNEIMIKAYDKAMGVNNDFYDKENNVFVNNVFILFSIMYKMTDLIIKKELVSPRSLY